MGYKNACESFFHVLMVDENFHIYSSPGIKAAGSGGRKKIRNTTTELEFFVSKADNIYFTRDNNTCGSE